MLWCSKLNGIITNYRATHKNSQAGFSLIEAMVATAIVGISFAGIYSMVIFAGQSARWAIAEQKLQMQANSILEVIEADIANIDSYNLDLTACIDPQGATQTHIIRAYQWCARMNEETGEAGTQTRSVIISDIPDGGKSALIILEAHGGKARVVMARRYGV